MMLLALGRTGVATVNRLQLGPTAILRQALLSGAVDLCVEYTGNAAIFFHQEGDPVWRDRASRLCARGGARLCRKPPCLAAAGARPTTAGSSPIPNALARDKGLNTLEDFAAFVRAGGRVRLAASAEFVESVAGLPAFESAYGFKLRANQLLVLSGGETTATMKAAADGISGVNAAMAYGSDGALNALDLVALEDPRHAEPVYAPAPVIRAATLEAWPQVRPALAPVFAGLDLKTLRALNEKVAVEGEDAGQRRARLPLDAEPVVTRGADAPDRVLLTLFCAGAAALHSLWLRHARGQPYRRWRSALLVEGAMAGRRRDSLQVSPRCWFCLSRRRNEPRRGGAARGRRFVLRLPRWRGAFRRHAGVWRAAGGAHLAWPRLLDPDRGRPACNA